MAPAARPASAPIPPSPASWLKPSLLPAAHLTCVGAARGEIDDIVDRYHEVGVRHIVALRGDPPGGIGTAYADASRRLSDFGRSRRRHQEAHADIEVSVSAYPEKHPESRDFDADIDMLKAKVDAGATRAITQVFFDNDLYFRYLDRVRARGIDDSDRARHHADAQFQAGAQLRHPRRHHACRTGSRKNSTASTTIAETRKLVAATVAAGQVQKLAKHGVDTFHFYTMNRADLVFAISHLLGIRPSGAQKAA